MVRRARLRSTAVRCLECRNGGGAQPARHLIERDGCGERRGVGAQDAGNSGGTISLYAFDPLNMGTTLFSAPAGSWIPASGTGRMGGALISPLVANGHVYVPTDGSVSVFGLLP